MAEIDWDLPGPHILAVKVQADDIDGLQHTNNAVYVQWCEQVAWSHSSSLGLDLACYQRLDRAMAVIRGEYDYLQASREGDELLVGTWIVSWGRSEPLSSHAVFCSGESNLPTVQGPRSSKYRAR